MEISADKWDEAKSLFEAALRLEPAARDAFLIEKCPLAELRIVLGRLLAAHEQAGAFLSDPVINDASPATPAGDGTFRCDDVLASRFKIARFIAKGGMGEVYQAEDLELREYIAIKTIRQDVLQQARVLARFKREVHLAKQVTHRNVCRIFDFFRHSPAGTEVTGINDVYFVTMELLLGETLSAMLRRAGKMSERQALPIVTQLASALGAAHKLGILHRDFKPGNIILCPNGASQSVRAVVTDFGLACRPTGEQHLETSLTTNELFGTPTYMSPEQIEGRELTTASDIYALGLVMYEMVSGVRPFETDSSNPIAQLIKRVKEAPSSPRRFVPELSQIWESVILKCLEYDPSKRFLNAEAVVLALSNECTNVEFADIVKDSDISAATGETQIEKPAAAETGYSAPRQLFTDERVAHPIHPEAATGSLSKWKELLETTSPRKLRLDKRAIWALAILTLIATVTVLGYLRRHDAKVRPQDQVVRAFINPPEKTEFLLTGDVAGPVAVSPDGTRLVFAAGGYLWERELKDVTSRRLEGTREAIFPFWSPDSGSIGFAVGNKLKTLDILSGRLVTVCGAPFLRGASWGPDGTILFAPFTRSEIWRVAASGGTPVAVTKLATGTHTTHRWPQFLPDGKHFLYFAANHDDPYGPNSATYIGSVDGKLDRPLVHSLARAEYASGYLVYVRDKALVAQSFDLDKLQLQRDATVLAEDVTLGVSTWGAVFSASQNGVLAYQSGGRTIETELRWYDRKGSELDTLGTGAYLSPRLSPDGLRLAVDFGDPNREVWVFDLKRSIKSRLTFGSYASAPLWSPDGAWIVFAGGKTYRDADIFRIKSKGQESRDPVYISSDLKAPTDWSSNGHFLLFDNDYTGMSQVYVLRLEGNHKPYPFLPSRFVQRSGRFSSDGHWVAYVSQESGSDEVYVAPFPGPGGKWQVSTGGGRMPRWRRDGRELFFVAPDNTLMAAEIEAGQSEVEVKRVQPLFRVNLSADVERAGSYDVTGDGSRFIINVNNDESTPPITLVLNWPALLNGK